MCVWINVEVEKTSSGKDFVQCFSGILFTTVYHVVEKNTQ